MQNMEGLSMDQLMRPKSSKKRKSTSANIYSSPPNGSPASSADIAKRNACCSHKITDAEQQLLHAHLSSGTPNSVWCKGTLPASYQSHLIAFTRCRIPIGQPASDSEMSRRPALRRRRKVDRRCTHTATRHLIGYVRTCTCLPSW